MGANRKRRAVLAERIELTMKGCYLGLISLNRPDKLNPLDWETLVLLEEALLDLSRRDEVRVICVTGKGKAFSAGGDLKSYIELQRDEVRFWKFTGLFHSICSLIEGMRKPVIALVNGYCVAGGLELLLACDFAYAEESARIGDGHINYGQMGGGGDLSRLVRRIHPARAREMLYSGRLLTAREALEWGLVNKVVPDGKLMEEAVRFADDIAAKSPLALGNMKEMVNKAIKMREEDSLALERLMCHHYCLTSHDAQEGLRSFAEKREAHYKGM